MARIRSIKPEFFLHEELAELSALHRLLFIGLWTLADKAGFLEDRPKRIKAALLPWEKCDVDRLLADLDAGGFILRYQGADGTACICIPGFAKHQRPHPKEVSYGLPTPPSREEVRSSRENSRQAAPDSTAIPSSPAGKEILENGGGDGSGNGGPAAPADPDPEPEDLGALWNKTTAPPLPRVADMGEARRKAAKAALRRRPLFGPSGWQAVFERVSRSAFCRGEAGDGWIADFDWAIRPEGKKPEPASKVLEGSYDRGPPTRAGGARFVNAQDMNKASFDRQGVLSDF